LPSIFDTLTAAPAAPATACVEGTAYSESPPLPTDSEPVTPAALKAACQELLRLGLLEQESKPNLYRTALTEQGALNRILEPLDLTLRLDDIRGLAWLQVANRPAADAEDDWSHPLVRRQRLTLEQSLLVALLRQHYVVHEQEAGVGAGEAKVALEDLLPALQLYLGEMGSDSQELNRLRGLLEKLRPHGIVSEVDEHEQVGIRPIIVHLANPENLQGLLQALRAAAQVGEEGEA